MRRFDVSHLNEVMPKVSIIIPNLNGKKFIERCLNAVMATDYPDFEIIIIDDVSTDGSIEIAEKSYGSNPRIRIIRNKKTLGAAGTRNVGISASHGDIIVSLDNDGKVFPNWLKELVKVIRSDPNIGAAQSKMISFDGKRLMCAGEWIIPYLGWPIVVGAHENDISAYDKVTDILASGGAVAFKREVTYKIGHFDSKLLHLQFEDLDFSWRIWIAGYRVVLAPKSVLHHEGSWTVLTLSKYKWANYITQRNCIRVLIKNHGLKNLTKYLPTSIAGMSFRALFHLIKRKDPYLILALLKAILWNLANLRDTMNERSKVQYLLRTVSDDYIMKRIGILLPPGYIYREFLRKGRV